MRNYKTIPLTQGKFAIVDEEDYSFLMQWKWCYSKAGKCGTYGYATRRLNKSKIKMHRVILNTPQGMDVDHINHNELDNRRCNLRNCTRKENSHNRKSHVNNTSGYKGVSWNKKNKKWRADIGIENKKVYLSLFQNKIEAAEAYNKAAIKIFGEFALLNKIPK